MLTVYLTGVQHQRALTTNFYLSLSIIAGGLFLFLNYGLYTGIGLVDNFPSYRNFKHGDIISRTGTLPDMPSIDTDDGISGLVLSVICWIALAIFFVIILVLLEAVFWISIFIILAMLYWVFFRALKLVFSKAALTKGNIVSSIAYSLGYTILFTGWIFGIVYLSQALR